MKILAIRGKNLTSLAGEFGIDFQAEPLASAGLFAISGPTGAGKSTLLDAVCLALYEETPRLSRKTGRGMEIPDVGKETLTQYDVRTLLRRGAAEGYAEVDFTGNDGRVYRARWSVRRAGGKAAGRLQKTEHSLLRLADQQRLGSTNSEVRKEIEQRVGLGFEQFTRAVILAQNEFAAFLKADDNQRGELLEALTGSDIYSDISIRAFERAKQEQATLQQLRARLNDQLPLGAEERAALESDIEQAAARLAGLDRSQAALDAHLRWFDENERLAALENEATDGHQAALAAQAASADLRALLAAIDAAQPARSLLADHDRLSQEGAAAEALLAGAHARLEAARHAQQQAADELTALRRAAETAEAAFTLAQPELDRAKALDAEMDMLRPARAQAHTRWENALAAAGLADEDRRRKQADLEETCRAAELIAAWLRENEDKRPLAQGWQRYDVLLAEAGQAYARHAAALAALGPALEREQQQSRTHADCVERLTQAERRLGDAAARRQETAGALARFDADDLLAAQKRAMRHKEGLMEVDCLWRDLVNGKSRQAALDEENRRLQREITAAGAAGQEASAALTAQQASLQQAERALRIAAAACGESIESLRGSLAPDHPCPVCGATDHPYRTQGRKLHAVLRELEAEVAGQRARLDDTLRRQAQQAALVDAGRTRLGDLEENLAALAGQVRAAESAFAAHPLVAADAGLLAGGLTDRLTQAEAELEALGQTEQQWRQAAEAAARAQAEHEAAAVSRAECAAALASAAGQAGEASLRRQTLAAQRQVAAAEQEALLTEIDPVFPGRAWRTDWQHDPQAFRDNIDNTVRQWLDNCRQHETLNGAHRIQAVAAAAAAEAATLAKRAEDEALRALNQVAGQLQQRQDSRALLFGGRSAHAAEQALHEGCQAARKQVDTQTTRVQQCQTELIRATEMLTNATSGLDTCRGRLAEARSRLDQWLAAGAASANPVPGMAALRELLAHGPDWTADQHKTLTALDHAVHQAAAVLSERSQRLAGHARQRPVAADVDTVRRQHQALADERRQAQDACTGLQLRLRNDDEQRRQAAELGQALAAREEAARAWAQLNELIGSADGKKFRNYAQQFTLDRLLAYANHHLAGISRRYRLERTDTLGLVAIDQEMGDEVRSVHSLSGGESFLISLALALALASLSSNRVRVDSLFIDEGFGSLDSDTLLIAMDALDSLQAQGRKVGVISHVQEMTERIETQIQIRRGSGGQSHIAVIGANRVI